MRLLIVLACLISCGLAAKQQSITTVNGLRGLYAPGDLIWEDTFDTFDATKWDYEANMVWK